MMDGAAKVFREFKWGLLTLFLLMVVVIGLVYDGGKKRAADKEKALAALPKLDAAPPKPDAAPNVAADDGSFSFGVESRPPEPSRVQPDGTLTQGRAEALGPAAQPRAGGTEPGTWNTLPPAALPPVPQRPPVLPRTSLSQATPVLPAPIAPQLSTETLYTVLSGDTLGSIAGRHYPGKTQRGIKALTAANKSTLPDIHVLKPGMKLKIPALAKQPLPAVGVEVATGTTVAAPVVEPSTPAPVAVNADEYTVQAGDTLERIARKQLGNGQRWGEIFELNRDRLRDPARLKNGQKLRIPDLKGGGPETPKITAATPEPQAEQEPAFVQQNSEPQRVPASSEILLMP